MAQSLEQYMAEATNAYKPAQTAIQTQLGALDSNLATAQDTINRNYAQQQKQLESQRNQAAEASSLAAAGSGGSFGGQANLARRKYYEQSFVPAQTQLQTNQANEMAKARQDYENQRTSLNAQMANLESQANQQALQQYWAAIEAEKQREAQLRAQREAQAAQDAYYNRLMQQIQAQNQGNSKQNVGFTDYVQNYSGWSDPTKQYWLNGLETSQKVNNAIGGAIGNTLNTALANRLQNSAGYNQYLGWRNS